MRWSDQGKFQVSNNNQLNNKINNNKQKYNNLNFS